MTTEISTVSQTVIVENPTTALVEVVVPGPQGPGLNDVSIGDYGDVDTSAKADGSVLYYDATAGKWKGDDINTVVTLTDGGAF